MEDNVVQELIDLFSKWGLNSGESLLYITLVKLKSATVQELRELPEFQRVGRTNIYRLIESLRSRNFITEEIKDKKSRFFPLSPESLVSFFLEQEKQKLILLENQSEKIIQKFQSISENNHKFSLNIPIELSSVILKIIPSKWTLKEPYKKEFQPKLGHLHEFEYNTKRKLGPDSAGIIIHQFQYPEHCEISWESIWLFHQEEIHKNLLNVGDQTPIRFVSVNYEIKPYIFYKGIKLISLHYSIKTNFHSKHLGGTTIYMIKEKPSLIFVCWASDIRDLEIMIKNASENFSIFQSNQLIHLIIKSW